MKFNVCLAALYILIIPTITQAAEWADLSGQFVFDGKIPVTNKRPAIPGICANPVKQDLVIDKTSKGIGNVFVYLRTASVIHPDLPSSKMPSAVFDVKECQFTPHCSLIRTGQTVMLKSQDRFVHNPHTYTARNTPDSLLIPGVDREGLPLKLDAAETLPMQVKCNMHPWMQAYWLILDHPYAALSATDGTFSIKKLPVGEHEFRIWHERVGYLKFDQAPKGRLKVTVKKDGTKLPPFKLNLKTLTDEDD